MPQPQVSLLVVCEREDSALVSSLEAMGDGLAVSTLVSTREHSEGPPAQLATALVAFEEEATRRSPDGVLLDCGGDPALAAALVFSKLGTPIARVRAAAETVEDSLANRLCDLVLDRYESDPRRLAESIVDWLSTYTLAR
jgi:hypothetical protein